MRLTSYEKHEALGHATTHEASPAGPLDPRSVETCSDCGQRWLHGSPGNELPITLGVIR